MPQVKKRRKRTFKLDVKPTDFIDKELVDKATLWTLRILLKLGGHREFIDKDNYVSKDSILSFLQLDKHLDTDENKYTRDEVLSDARETLEQLEKQNNLTTVPTLSKNIAQISKLLDLNRYEEQILEFNILSKQYEILDDAVSLLGSDLNTKQAKRALSVILDIPKDKVDKALKSNSKLVRSALVVVDKRNRYSLDRKFDSISDEFIDNMLTLDEDVEVMIKDSIRTCTPSTLKLKDYKHIQDDLDILVPYVKNSIKTKQKGVNILLYGLPGTGKTELVKVLAKKLKAKLYEVSYTDEDGESKDGKERLKAYKSAQALLGSKKTILMYDEAEDIFESSDGFLSLFMPTRQKDKAWINRTLETNEIPTIWITNNIFSVDNAIVRRFDLSIELPIPPKSKRIEIIENYSKDILDKKTKELLAANEDIAPALISNTTKVLSTSKSNSSEQFRHIVSNTLKAQGFGELVDNSSASLPSVYKPEYVNTDVDLEELAQGIKNNPNARLCLYGAAGTGKSAYGKYVAEILDKPIILKKSSDLQSKWVGEAEKNIADAFKEAKNENAVLIFDEVDSFLQDRTKARASWEISQVNEMLVQMENFDGIFIATTNLMKNLDKASLRRFDLKLEFGYLNSKQSVELFEVYAKDMNLSDDDKDVKRAVKNLKYLAPGDFSAVLRQSKFQPIADSKDLLKRLKNEIAAKNEDNSNVMGFIQS